MTFVESRRTRPGFSVIGMLDARAGNWPSESFMELDSIAKKCLDVNYETRPEIEKVVVIKIISVVGMVTTLFGWSCTIVTCTN